MNTLITITNLSINIESKKIIQNMNLSMTEEEILTVIGRSGCGKSTFLKSILGLVAYEGSINIQNSEISYMPQDLALFNFKTVYDNVIIPLKVKKQMIDEKQIDNLLKELGIFSLKYEKVENLSGGEQSRVALVRALVSNNKILLLDEPLSKLDYITKYSILDILRKLKDKYGLTLIYVTHDIDEVLYFSDKILIMNKNNDILVNKKLEKDKIIGKI